MSWKEDKKEESLERYQEIVFPFKRVKGWKFGSKEET